MVLGVIGPDPVDFVTRKKPATIEKQLAGFKHRFTTGSDLAGLLAGAGAAIRKYGSLNECFRRGIGPADTTVVPALARFTSDIAGLAGRTCDFLMPSAQKGSACKRLNLYMRWMVRSDAVDPGGWTGVDPAMLVVPLDTHMHRAGLALGLTARKQADLRTAVEVTEGFRGIVPGDPVRYDFALTRLGIRGEQTLDEFLTRIDVAQG